MNIQKAIKTLPITFLLIFILAAPGFSATHTVKSSGGDYSSIQACVNAAGEGDVCLVSSGNYSGATITSSGSPGNHITIKAESGASQPTISGTIDFTNESYITVDGFDGPRFSGNGCSFIWIKNNTIRDRGLTNVRNADDILVDGNTFRGQTDDTINQWGDRWVIRNNIAQNYNAGSNHFDFWQTHCGNTYWGQYTLIENNLYTDVIGGHAHFVLFNQSDKCGSSIAHQYIVRYNKVRNIGSGGIYFDDVAGGKGHEGVAVYNNSFVELYGGSTRENSVGHIDLATSGTGFFYNNIVYDSVEAAEAMGFSPASNIPVDGMLAYDPDATMKDLDPLDDCLKEGKCISNKNPDFKDVQNDDFSLKAGSPAIDAGYNLTTVATSDSGSGTSLIVNEPWFFQDGWAGVNADWIAVGSVSNTVQISSINYSTGVITLTRSISRSDGDPVYLYRDSDGTQVLSGSAPDIGAVESNGKEIPNNLRF
jgi:hypothetical protein